MFTKEDKHPAQQVRDTVQILTKTDNHFNLYVSLI
jgi:hypothetical protein